MPKKKRQSKQIPRDFTLDNYANAQNPIKKANKMTTPDTKEKNQADNPSVGTWDQISDDEELHLVKETNSDGTIHYNCIRQPNKTNANNSQYPEIVWHEISRRIRPEDIARFALINKTTYAITQKKSFWVDIYDTYCKNSPKLPKSMQIEDGAKSHGYKTRTIRALYHTYAPFVNKIKELDMHDGKPHDMIKCQCVNMWFYENIGHWVLCFKFKKLPQQQAENKEELDFIEDLGRLDANPELDNQIMLVKCKELYEIRPEVLGMKLTSVKMGLSKTLRTHKLHLGFNSGAHVNKNILPECTIVIDTVISVKVISWWHPKYPNFSITINWDKGYSEREEDWDAPVPDSDLPAGYRIYQKYHQPMYRF